MTAKVVVDGKALFLNPFITILVGNVIDGVLRSLKAPEGSNIEFLLRKDDLQLFVDQAEVPLDLGHARQIVGNILKGLLSSLKGAENGEEFRFLCER
jgi:hypothetical protein